MKAVVMLVATLGTLSFCVWMFSSPIKANVVKRNPEVPYETSIGTYIDGKKVNDVTIE